MALKLEPGTRLVVATHNAGKARELAEKARGATITPSDLDFGTVKKNCNSPRRIFNIYNTCTGAVTVNSYGMLAAAGVPAGSMYCPGTSPCPEFLIDGTPGFMAGSVIPSGSSMPVTFALKYKPPAPHRSRSM